MRLLLAVVFLVGAIVMLLFGERVLSVVLNASPAITRSRATPTPLPPGVRGQATLSTQPDPARDVVVEMTEADLNARLVQEVVGKPVGQTAIGAATFDSLSVALKNGRAEITGNARVGGTSVPIEAQAGITPDGVGGLRVSLSDAKVAGLPVPAAARTQLEQQMQLELDQAVSAQPMAVRSVEIGNGKLRAVGQAKRP
jgi:hypothetical protein